MKKFIYSILFLAVSLTTLQSCDSDDDSSDPGNDFSNEVSIAGTVTNLSPSASLFSYGENGDGSFDWDVTLSSTTANGLNIYFDLNTNSVDGLVAGTYTYSNSRAEFTYVDLEVYTNDDTSDYNVQEGTVVIAISGENTSMTFNLVATDGTPIVGQWTGQFDSFDED
ncbi:hypothetical protein [Psychroserpens damuponensis]|uniref:hypothetical protein n=1 Tax=Psychroserpens damuponensis TaxID=943936 RepID=UPI00058DB6B4|nr:hypothetical protein [Psychroserpens damuponensis]